MQPIYLRDQVDVFAKGKYEGGMMTVGKRKRYDGFGVLAFVNGDRYEGEWRADKRHGEANAKNGVGKVRRLVSSRACFCLT
jgi:hypothetical protein